MNGSADNILARLGIHRIEAPTAFSTFATNCYFIDGALPTLIDTAVATDEAYDSLVLALSRAGRSIRDIARIVLTHGHADHRALAPRIREESGAEVFCHRLEAGKVIHTTPEEKASSRSRSADFFRSMGVPDELLGRLAGGSQSPAVRPRLERASFLDDGDEVALDNMRLRVLHTPGHSCGSVCLYDVENRLIFTGDTLLPTPRITPLIEVDILDEQPDYNPLKFHIRSLRRLLEVGASLVLPGHGAAFDEYGAIVNELFERHRKRQLHILRSLRRGRRTLYQICRSVFPLISSDDLYLALSEVAGNVGILIEEERVVGQREDEMVYYESV